MSRFSCLLTLPLALALALGVLAAPAPALAQPPGVAQLPGADGCFTDMWAAQDCQPGRGVAGATGIALSPDGAHAYVAGLFSDAVAGFERDPATGALAQAAGAAGCVSHTGANGCALAPALDGASDVAVSPDGRHVYAVSEIDDAVVALRRDAVTGALTPVEGLAACVSHTGTNGACTSGHDLDQPVAVTVSADGAHVLVAAYRSDAVQAFSRDPLTGGLLELAGAGACVSETGSSGRCLDGRGLDGVSDLVLDASGTSAYAASAISDAVSVLRRDPATGALGQEAAPTACVSETGSAGACADGRALDGARGLALAPDDSHLYVAARVSDAVAGLLRDASDGGLVQLPDARGCVSETGASGCLDGRALDGARQLAVAPGGDAVIAAAGVSEAVVVLPRDAGTGALDVMARRSGCVTPTWDGRSDCSPGRALSGIRSVAAAAGGVVYATADWDDGVAVFGPDRDPACAPTRARVTAGDAVTVSVPCEDPNSGTLQLSLTAPAPRGSVSTATGAPPTLTYRAPADWSGTVRLDVEAVDLGGGTARTTVTIDVVARPPAPPAPAVPPAPVPAPTPRTPLPAPKPLVPVTPLAPAGSAPIADLIEPARRIGLAGPALGLDRDSARLAGARKLALTAFCVGAAGRCRGDLAVALPGRPLARAGYDLAAGDRTRLLVALPAPAPRPRADGRLPAAVAAGDGAPVELTVAVSRRRARVRVGSGGRDRLFGGSGADDLRGGRSSDWLSGAAGVDRLGGSFGNDRLSGGSGDDVLSGGSGGDRVDGGGGGDRLDGGTGDDWLWGGSGDDRLDGYDGDDTIRAGAGDDYLVERRFGNDRLLDGGPGDDYVDGNRGADRDVRGGTGDDIVRGGPGDDRLDGGSGRDFVDGGEGNDVAEGGDGSDVLVGGRGSDRLRAGAGDDVLYGSTGSDHFDCGPGTDTVHTDLDSERDRLVGCERVVHEDPTREGALAPVTAAVNRGLLAGGPNGAKRGSAVGDGPSPDRPRGDDGDDVLRGTDQRDTLLGNGGDDRVLGGGGNDDLEGGDGNDVLEGGAGADRLFGRFGHDTILGQGGDDELEGSRGRDRLVGGPGDDRLNGGFDADRVEGGSGDDVVIAVAGGRDVIDCGPGRDRVAADPLDVVRSCERRLG